MRSFVTAVCVVCPAWTAGVGVALSLYDVTIAFVNCHLASKNLKERRTQYTELVGRCDHGVNLCWCSSNSYAPTH